MCRRILLEKGVLIGTGRGSISLPRPEHVEVEKKAPPFRRARLRLGALDICGRCGLPHESKFGARRLVPEEGLTETPVFCLTIASIHKSRIRFCATARFRFTVRNFPSD
jgi:hypothetical protein